MLALGTLAHVKQMSRSPFEVTIALVVPIVQATLAVYLFRAGQEPHRLLEAAVGAGLMGVWSSVLFGSGGWMNTGRTDTVHAVVSSLAVAVLVPRRPVRIGRCVAAHPPCPLAALPRRCLLRRGLPARRRTPLGGGRTSSEDLAGPAHHPGGSRGGSER